MYAATRSRTSRASLTCRSKSSATGACAFADAAPFPFVSCLDTSPILRSKTSCALSASSPDIRYLTRFRSICDAFPSAATGSAWSSMPCCPSETSPRRFRPPVRSSLPDPSANLLHNATLLSYSYVMPAPGIA
eukprot:3228419-Rhodomonas_salina.1